MAGLLYQQQKVLEGLASRAEALSIGCQLVLSLACIPGQSAKMKNSEMGNLETLLFII